MLLAHATWPDIAAYLERQRTLVLPIGSTEQHGPVGLIGTDALCADALARELGAATGTLVAPPFNYGMAQHHLGFPGTISLRPTTLIRVVVDALEGLQRTGFERFFFVNGHGGNEAPLRAAFAELHATLAAAGRPRARRILCDLRNWWQLPGVVALAAELYADAEGYHATPSEVALTRHLFPETQREVALEPLAPCSGEVHGAEDFRARYPDGRMGSDSGLARAEHGARFLAAALGDLVPTLSAFASAPLPGDA
jgi:creatinine amidohydrolase